MVNMGLKIEPISTALGARILGLNLECVVSESDLSHLKHAFFKYHLLCIEGTPLNVSNFLRFARLIGEPQMQLLRNRYDEKILKYLYWRVLIRQRNQSQMI